METGQKQTIAVVGLGVGLAAHLPSLRDVGFDVVALCARNAERVAVAAAQAEIPHAYTSFDDLLAHPDLDAISIATPPPSHCNLVLKALEAGKHVLVEKELATSVAEARLMSGAVRKSGRIAMVAQAFRFAPSRACAEQLLKEGYIGTPRHINITFFWGPPEPGPMLPDLHWRNSLSTGGGMSGGQMATFFDAVTQWFGPVSSISGLVRVAEPGRVQSNGVPIDADDMLSATFECANGVLGSIAIGIGTPYGGGGRIEIHGSAGSLVIHQPKIVPSDADWLEGGRYVDGLGTRKVPIPATFSITPPNGGQHDSMFHAYWPLTKAFHAAITSGSSSMCGFEQSLHLQAISEALRISSTSGRRVTVSAEQGTPASYRS